MQPALSGHGVHKEKVDQTRDEARVRILDPVSSVSSYLLSDLVI